MYVSPGSMGVMMKAVMMVKFQAGLDASTLADRFNFEAYPQIVRHFGMEDYEAWDLGMCPVPVRLVRVKTGMAYTTFIDRDAVSHLQDYLRWRGFREGKKYDPSGPLFVTRRGTPVSPGWVSFRFSKAAIDAGIQKWVSNLVYKIHPHEVRDLLKSTLMVSGCAQYAADHVLGHAPRDSYEKQAGLYPEALRSEYAKASGRLNIFSGIERYLRAAGADPGEGAATKGSRRSSKSCRRRSRRWPAPWQTCSGSWRQAGKGVRLPCQTTRWTGSWAWKAGRTRRIPGIRQGADPIGFALIMWHFGVPRACRRIGSHAGRFQRQPQARGEQMITTRMPPTAYALGAAPAHQLAGSAACLACNAPFAPFPHKRQ